MSQLNIEATRNTPSVFFDIPSATFRMQGHSILENAGDFYTPILKWLKANLAQLEVEATFEFDLPYFNSSSMKALYLLLREVKKEAEKGKCMDVIWYVEDGDDFMSEAVETFTEMVGIPLTLKNGHTVPSTVQDVEWTKSTNLDPDTCHMPNNDRSFAVDKRVNIQPNIGCGTYLWPKNGNIDLSDSGLLRIFGWFEYR